MKTIKIFLAAMVGMLTVGCYNDFEVPAAEKVYTDTDMALMGLSQISIADLKAQFGPISNTGTNSGWATTKTLKLGSLSGEESSFTGLSAWPEAANYYIKGKVTTSDRQGNIYKSIFIDDGTAGIELKLYNGLYLDYHLDLNTMESQWVYVKLGGLYLGNYRMMLSLGGAPSDAINVAGTHKYYANSNIDNPEIAAQNFFAGERTTLDATNIIEVDPSTYTKLGEAYLGRLVRFTGIKVSFAGVTYQNPIYDDEGNITGWGDEITKSSLTNGSNSNPYPSWIVTDTKTPQFGAWYYWAYNRFDERVHKNVQLYGSVVISYLDEPQYTSQAGVYSVRTSGYSLFGSKPIPADETVGNVLGIYGIYASSSNFSGSSSDWAQYQISVSRYEDLDFPAESLLSEAWIEHNTPEASYAPPVKLDGDDDATE